MKQFKSFCPTQACTTPDFGFLGSQNSAFIDRGCGGGDGGNAAPEQQGRVEESEDSSEEEDEDEKKVFKFTLFISSTVSPSTSLVKIICEHSSRNFCLSCYRTRSTVGFARNRDIVALVQKKTYVECTEYVRRHTPATASSRQTQTTNKRTMAVSSGFWYYDI